LKEVADILNEQYRDRGYRIPKREIPDFLIRLLGRFDKRIALVVPGLGWDYSVSTQHAREILGWQPRPVRESIIDMAESMIQQGLV
jgi:nucleoside-diphosphate-sugar epimerase